MKFIIKPKGSRSPLAESPGTIGSFMTIDPGLGGTGYAIWDRETKFKLCPPIDSGSINDTGGSNLWLRISSILIAIEMISRRHAAVEFAIEKPQFFEGGKGLAAARGGDLITLTMLAGAIAGRLGTSSHVVHFIPIPDWKGNMDKDATLHRVQKRLPNWKPKTNTTHEIDAVGIGLWLKEEI